MPCYSPITAYRAKTTNENGKRPLVFNARDGFRDLPVQIQCGSCIGCRLEYSRQWAIRCVHEASLHEENAFITLTYSQESLPEDHSISKDEVQRFFKRLRKITGQPLRYFACGEYGEANNRPHYHAIIFGYGFPDKTLWTKQNGHLLYRSQTLEKAWKLGHSSIGDVTFQSAAYVARYVMKKRKGEDTEKHYRIVDKETGEEHQQEPEFCLMSRRPGIGSRWLRKYKTDTDKDFITVNRVKMTLPKYYDSILEKMDQEAFKTRKRERQAQVDNSDNTPTRLRTKEKVKKAQLNFLKRTVEEIGK